MATKAGYLLQGVRPSQAVSVAIETTGSRTRDEGENRKFNRNRRQAATERNLCSVVFLQKRSQHLFWRSVCFHLARVIAEELHVALAFSLLDTQKPPQLILQMITSRDKYV